MQQFYRYFCAELVNHTASQSPIKRGVLFFDPQVLKDEPDVTGKPAFDLLANTMVRFNWIERNEADSGQTEYDSLIVDLRVNIAEIPANSVDYLCDKGFMEARPNLFKSTS